MKSLTKWLKKRPKLYAETDWISNTDEWERNMGFAPKKPMIFKITIPLKKISKWLTGFFILIISFGCSQTVNVITIEGMPLPLEFSIQAKPETEISFIFKCDDGWVEITDSGEVVESYNCNEKSEAIKTIANAFRTLTCPIY
jgi:hypothetical protein